MLQERSNDLLKLYVPAIHHSSLFHDWVSQYTLETAHESSLMPFEEVLRRLPPENGWGLRRKEQCAWNGDMAFFQWNKSDIMSSGDGYTRIGCAEIDATGDFFHSCDVVSVLKAAKLEIVSCNQ